MKKDKSITVECKSNLEFEDTITKLLNEGWEFDGEMNATIKSDNIDRGMFNISYVQTMMK